MKLFSENTELIPLVNMILNEDINGLRKELENGWNINEEIQASKYIREFPILIALYYDRLKVVDFLIQNGAELNMESSPVIPAAADSCSLDTIKLLLKHGADLHAVDNVGSNAIHRALINKRYDLMLELISLGIDVKMDGTILCSAVLEKDYTAIKILLDQNIDVNYHTPDMVFPYNSTPVCVAAENNDFDTVKLLVEHGADVAIKDAYGERPFTAAHKNKNYEMMEYLKALEPEGWHNQEQRLIALKSYKLPKKMINYLCGEELRLDINNNLTSYIVFNSLVDCKEVKWNGYKFLDLLSDVDNYRAGGFLVWYPKGKCLATADFEHERFKILDKWDDFIKNPSNTIDKVFK